MTVAQKSKISRFERVSNLALALLHAEIPLTLERLVDAIPGYPKGGDEATLRMAFERDKRILREQALNIVARESVTSRGLGYTVGETPAIDSPSLDLSHEEIISLSVALCVFRFKNAVARNALVKLARRVSAVELEDEVAASTKELVEEAVGARRSIRLVALERAFDIDPYGIVETVDSWTLVGRDRHFDGIRVRSFAASDISAVVLGPPLSFTPPQQFDPTTHADPSVRFSEMPRCEQGMANRGLDAGGRFGRLMNILSYLAAKGPTSTQWLATMMQLQPRDLVSELETAACFGVAPFTPDKLLDICVDATTVAGFDLEIFEQPAELSPEEIVEAAFAAQALLDIRPACDSSSVRSALSKCALLMEMTPQPAPVKVVDWPSEWSSLVRFRVTEVLPWFKHLVVDDPKIEAKGPSDVVAFLADRRWQCVLLTALGNYGELLDRSFPLHNVHFADRRVTNVATAV